jgi:hypothetical protein
MLVPEESFDADEILRDLDEAVPPEIIEEENTELSFDDPASNRRHFNDLMSSTSEIDTW